MPTLRFGTLDFYDDHGTLLKSAVPDATALPDFVKTASQVGQEGHANLFALVMIDEDGGMLRKYATADAGNTWLSVLYFGLTHQNLPPEAEKIAAANLLQACEAYEIDPPDCVLDLSGDDPPQGNLVYLTRAAAPATQQVMQKIASVYALPEEKRYPLDTLPQVQRAQEYFVEQGRALPPRERHTFAVKMASAARAIGLEVVPAIEKHASERLSPNVQGHLGVRFHHLLDIGASKEHTQALEKLASSRTSMAPAAFAEALEKFDRESGLDAFWDKTVSDPWYSTFGMDWGMQDETLTKVASEGPTEDRLRALADSGTIDEHFGVQVGNAFREDPVTVYASMPLPQKKLIAQIAGE